MRNFFQTAMAGIRRFHTGVISPQLVPGAHNMMKASTHLKFQGAFLAYTLFASRGTPEEKMHTAATQVGTFLMTAGMRSGWRQAFWQVGLALAPNMPDLARGVVQGYRSVLEARTMASVPFSYSTLAMDQAWSSMQYGHSRLQESYSTLGGEAAMFSARYMQR